MKYIAKYISIFLLLLTGLSSCQQEEYIIQTPPSDNNTENGLFMTIVLPEEESSSQTRYVNGTSGEKAINNMYAIYFQNSKCTGYEKLGAPILTEVDTVHYRMKKYPNGSNIEIVFIPNLESAINPDHFTPFESQWKDKTLDDLRERLSMASNPIWARNTGGSQQYIPMYAHARNLTLPASLSASGYIKDGMTAPVANHKTIRPYSLVRMMAKIKIENLRADASIPNANIKLNLDTVWVVNGHNKGYICYGASAWNDTDKRVKSPTINVANKMAESMKLSLTKDNGTTAQSLVFYTYETGNAASADINSTSNCHIILKGRKGNDATFSKFLIPIPKLDNNAGAVLSPLEPGPILRNHEYIYTIKGVKNVVTFDVTVRVIGWTPGNIPGIVLE